MPIYEIYAARDDSEMCLCLGDNVIKSPELYSKDVYGNPMNLIASFQVKTWNQAKEVLEDIM